MQLRFAFVVLLAGCPPKPPGSVGSAQKPAAGCPSANNVFVASYLTPGQGQTYRAGWVLPLSDAAMIAGTHAAEYQNLDPAAASAAGVPAAPTGNIWILAANAAPCQAQLGKYYGVRIDDPSPNISYGIELDGCPAPADQNDVEAVALVSVDPPSQCRFESPNPIASRFGEMDPQQQWHAPIKETPIPPALATIVPPHECKSPACETLWAFAEIAVDHKPVAWSGAVNWLEVGDPKKPCEWRVETFSGFFVPDTAGKPVKIDAGQKHPLPLAAALVDQGGARVLLAEAPGGVEYATYDLVPGGAQLGHAVTWLMVSNAMFDAIDHLGPMCPPPGQPPPPAAPAH